jgi:hypothetical protein
MKKLLALTSLVCTAYCADAQTIAMDNMTSQNVVVEVNVIMPPATSVISSPVTLSASTSIGPVSVVTWWAGTSSIPSTVFPGSYVHLIRVRGSSCQEEIDLDPSNTRATLCQGTSDELNLDMAIDPNTRDVVLTIN